MLRLPSSDLRVWPPPEPILHASAHHESSDKTQNTTPTTTKSLDRAFYTLSLYLLYQTNDHTYEIIMDYEGQRLSELIFYWIILAISCVGWVIGYFRQEFFIVFKFWLVSVAISVVVSAAILRVWLLFVTMAFDSNDMFFL